MKKSPSLTSEKRLSRVPPKSLDLNKNEYLSLDKSSTSDSVDEGKELLINFNIISIVSFNINLCIKCVQMENLVALGTVSLYKEPKKEGS